MDLFTKCCSSRKNVCLAPLLVEGFTCLKIIVYVVKLLFFIVSVQDIYMVLYMDAMRPYIRLICGRGTGFGLIAPPLLEIGEPK
jgi:hypothetical protein